MIRDGWDDTFLGQAILQKSSEISGKALEKEEKTMEASDLIEQNFEKSVLKNKIDSLKEEMSLFSRTLDQDHLENAKSLFKELEEENHPQPDLLITCKELFEAGFQF